MELVRKLATVYGLTTGAMLVAIAVTDWLLGLSRGWVIGAMVVAALLGLAGGLAEAKGLKPYDAGERRDAVLGWSIVLGLITVIATVALVSATVGG